MRDSAPNVRIVEPVMQVDKTAAPHIADQGDTITFTLDVRHDAVSYNAHAYNVALSDVIPAGLTYVADSLLHTGVGLPPATLSESGGTISAAWPAFLTTDTSQLQFQATVDIGVPLGSLITNTAGIEWTSLPGDVSSPQSAWNPLSVERTGDLTGVNNYWASDRDEVAIQNPAMSKVLVTPAWPYDVTIGQTLTYEITLTIPEGVAGSAVLADTLDAGLAIVNLPDLATHLTIDADPAITTSLGDFDDVIAAAVVAGDGSSLTLDFGTLTNSDTNNTTAETIVITYDVVVLNKAVNTAGQMANNAAVFSSTAGTLAASALDITIVEPDLQISKSNSVPLVAEAGDRVVFTLVVEHTGTSTATAYDVVLTDLFTDNDFAYDHTGDPLTVVSGPAPTSITESPAAGDLTAVWDSFPLGSVTVLAVPVRLDLDTPIGTTLTNVADLTWSSRPGDVTTPQSSNPVSVERTGDPADPGGVLNDYREQGTGITQTPVPTFIKQLDSTSHDGTGRDFHDPAIADVAIGEEVTFLMIGLVPDGEIHTLPLTDTLPAGMELVSAVVLAVGDDIYEDSSYSDPLTPAEVIVNTTATTVEYVFPEYIYNDPNPAVPGALDNTFLFEVTAVVTNVASNQDGVPLTNMAEAGYYDAGGNPQKLPAYASMEVVEPDLDITKAASPTSGVSGDTITFTVTVDHTPSSTAHAYEVEIADILPPEMTYAGNLQLVHGFLPTVSQVGQTLIFSWNEIPHPPASPGPTDAPYTFTFDVLLNANLQFGQTVTNDAVVTWQSLPGTTDHTRDGSGGLVPGVLNDYAATDGDTVTSNVTARNAAKSLVLTSETTTTDPDVVIGEIVRYRLQVAVDQGTLPDFRLTDLLPAGLQFLNDGDVRVAFVSDDPTKITSSSPLLNDPSPGTAPDLNLPGNETTPPASLTPQWVLDASLISGGPFGDGTDPTFSLGTIVNSEVDANQEFVIVEFHARVLDVAGNESGDTLSNQFAAYSGTTLLNTSTPIDVTVVEPRLTVQKSAVPVDGTRARYTVRVENTAPSTAAAVQAVITDVLAGPGITLDDGSVTIDPATTVPGGNVTITTGNGAGDTTIRLDVSVFPLGTVLMFHYDATLNNPGQQSEAVNNTANAAWTSAASHGRNGTAGDSEVLGAIGDHVWYDLDGQGDQDVGEPGWPGVTVQLEWGGPDGDLDTPGDNVTLTTTTDALGNYQFGLLPAGAYRVTATPPAGTVPTFDADGGLDNTSTLNLPAGAVNPTQDFGYWGTGSIGDTVWVDLDGDGSSGPFEPGIPGVTVNLVWFGPDGAAGGGDDVHFSTVTDASGTYSFPRLPVGSFQVDLATGTLPEGLTANTPISLPVTLAADEHYADADFGARGTGMLGDRVFLDSNGSGVFEPGEGWPGVRVTVSGDFDGDGTDESFAVTTGPDGLWTLDGLRTTADGVSYTVTVNTADLPPGEIQFVDPDGVNDNTSTAVLSTLSPARLDLDFGYRAPPVAVSDVARNVPPGPIMIQVTAQDSDPDGNLVVSSVDLDPATPGQQMSRVVPGEGTWTVSTTNPGYVTFTPEPGFTVDPTPIPYVVLDSTDLVSNVATIAIDYRAVATNDSSSGNTPGDVVTLAVVDNDTTGDTVNPATVQIVLPPTGSTLSPDGKTLTVPGEGEWTVNSSTGAITFTPETDFTGDPTPIRYTVADHEGNVSNPALVTVDYVAAACSAFPFTLVMDDLSTSGIDIIVVDNAPIGTVGAGGLVSNRADLSNTTLGEIYFSGSTARFSLARTTAKSKPLVGTGGTPDITLTSAFRSSSGGTIVVQATDGCYQVVAGTPHTLTSPIGGTTNGTVSFTETVDPSNAAFATGPNGVTNALGPFKAGSFSQQKSAAFTPDLAYASLAKKATVTHPTGSKLTTLNAGGTVAPLDALAAAVAAAPGWAGPSDLLFASLGRDRGTAPAERRPPSAAAVAATPGGPAVEPVRAVAPPAAAVARLRLSGASQTPPPLDSTALDVLLADGQLDWSLARWQ